MSTPFAAHIKLGYLFLLISLVGSGIPSHATGLCLYDRNSAIHYANLYANPPGNTGYYHFPGNDAAGNDCASFVSQCLIAGGIDVVSQANKNGWGYMLHAPSGYPQVISVANDLAYFLMSYSDHHGDQVDWVNSAADVALPDGIVKGDIISLWDDSQQRYYHSLIIVQTISSATGWVYASGVTVDCHSSLNDEYNYQQPLINWWGTSAPQVPTVRFFHINRTGEEATATCSPVANPCPHPPCCGQSLGKITAPTEIE